MTTLFLLLIIYLAFISLGLPDSLLGVAWPLIREHWDLPLDYAGMISIVTIGSTILSSLFSGRIIARFGTGKVTFISCLMTGSALLGFSIAPSFVWLFLFAIPLGFGAGSVDTALNNYVSLHFKSHHMNWLHSFWGVGATIGPLIMGQFLINSTWQSGYRFIGSIQMVLAFILLISLPLWKLHHAHTTATQEHIEPNRTLTFIQKIQIKGVPFALLAFLFYVTAEAAVGLWGSSYLVQIKNISAGLAATWIAMYYGGITIGRLISGFVSFKLSNQQLVFYGILISLIGVLLMLLPLPHWIIPMALILIGLGFAPIFPSLIHETPERFGKDLSQDIIGYQIAAAYLGGATLPPLFGVVAKHTSMALFPPFILLCLIFILISTTKLNHTQRKI
jgi:fucose permease